MVEATGVAASAVLTEAIAVAATAAEAEAKALAVETMAR